MNNSDTKKTKPRYSSKPSNGKAVEIRSECFRPFYDGWAQPTADEVRELIRLTGYTGGQVAKVVGLGADGARTVRRWIGGDSPIHYAVWAILCDCAGIERIWESDGTTETK